MTREEIIAKMAEDADTTKVAAKAALDSFIGCVTKTLKKGGKVSLVGFGTFSKELQDRAETRRPVQQSTLLQEKSLSLKLVKVFLIQLTTDNFLITCFIKRTACRPFLFY